MVRRKYKSDFIRFLVVALASNDETIDHLEILHETKSLNDQELFNDLYDRLHRLGRKLNSFIKAVEAEHNNFSSKQRLSSDSSHNPVSEIKNPES
ncbi:MAG: four helix bundle protein [Cyclobacteriaceae bacterium]|nr:four helix bundle protein [Cyclobacteriaceae bacterium]